MSEPAVLLLLLLLEAELTDERALLAAGFSLSLPLLAAVFMRKKFRRRWLTWPPGPFEPFDDGMVR
jgi:hypothetical protein